MNKIRLFFTFLALLFLSCTTIKAQSKYTDNKEINTLIKKKREYNRNNGVGYRIQLYNGSESRAKNIRNNFKSDFRGVYTKLVYEAPDWKVQVGNYRTKLDADRALNNIKEKYSGGIIIEK